MTHDKREFARTELHFPELRGVTPGASVPDINVDDPAPTDLAEAYRVLKPGGLLCTVGLTRGTSPSAKIGGLAWRSLFKLTPKLVGGCRPVVVREFLGDASWTVRYSNIVTRFGISSEILVAART